MHQSKVPRDNGPSWYSKEVIFLRRAQEIVLLKEIGILLAKAYTVSWDTVLYRERWVDTRISGIWYRYFFVYDTLVSGINEPVVVYNLPTAFSDVEF